MDFNLFIIGSYQLQNNPFTKVFRIVSPAKNISGRESMKNLKRKVLVIWSILILLIIMIPGLIIGLVDTYVINFADYERRIFKEYSANTNKGRYKKDGSPNFILNPMIMALSNWKVSVKSSGLRTKNVLMSMCLGVKSREHNQDVLGVRINFPETRQNDRAIISPQFEFNAYNVQGNFANLSNGVVANVGYIKEVSIWVKGRNYPYNLALRLANENNIEKEFFFGHMKFDNWRKLTWLNPNYIDSIKDRILIRKPMYPKDLPYFRFRSLVVYRQMDQIGGDFIVYFRNIRMIFEEHTSKPLTADINDEKVWKIMQKKAQAIMDKEHKKLADKADIYRNEINRLKKKK